MQFVKDISTEPGYSKINHLAVQVAKARPDTRYACPENPAVAVWQLGDGMAVVDRRFVRPVVIVHDWYPHYAKYLEKAGRIVFLGNFDHPEYPTAKTLASYPFDPEPKIPSDGTEVLVEGVYDGSCEDWVLGECEGKRVRFACFGNDDPDCDDAQGRLLAGIRGVASSVVESRRPSELMLLTYMRSADRVVHCGSGRRGFLHSAAVSYGGRSQTRDDGFTVSTILDLVALLPA